MNITELKKSIADRLSSAGIAEADNDTYLLIKEYTGVIRADFLTDPDMEVPSGADLKGLEEAVSKRCERIPLQHITGKTGFMGFDFYTTPAALIPRPDTEILAEEVLKDYHDGSRILDLCTGTGCIIVSLLALMNDCYGVGTDISQDALALAEKNAGEILGEKRDRLRLLQGDLYEALSSDDKFEVIVSNPPYIRTSDIDTLMPEVKDHDPFIALDGGKDGLDFYRKIIVGASAHLCGGGDLVLEIGADQAEDVMNIMKENRFIDVQVIKDYGGNDRVVRGILSSL